MAAEDEEASASGGVGGAKKTSSGRSGRLTTSSHASPLNPLELNDKPRTSMSDGRIAAGPSAVAAGSTDVRQQQRQLEAVTATVVLRRWQAEFFQCHVAATSNASTND